MKPLARFTTTASISTSTRSSQSMRDTQSRKDRTLTNVWFSTDYEFQTTGGHVFTINACRNPVRESHGLKDVNEKDIGGFIRQDHRDFSIGCVFQVLDKGTIYDTSQDIKHDSERRRFTASSYV